MAAGRTVEAFREVLGRNQRTADHARGWRHSLAQRCAAAVAGPFRLSPANPVLPGVPSPVKHPEKVNMVIFRENTEDIYAGIDTPPGRRRRKKSDFLQNEFPKQFDKIPFGTKEKAKTFWKMVGAEESDDVCGESGSNRSVIQAVCV